LVEGAIPGRATRMRGRTPSQAPDIDGSIFFKGDAAPGEFITVRIDKALTYDLSGRMIDAQPEDRMTNHG
jgi:hypothetical protein